MYKAINVANYFLEIDKNKLFNNSSLRLNKYLFLAQVVYLAKYDKKLFKDDFCAYDNGPVIKDIMKNYLNINNNSNNLSDEDKLFLDKIYYALENATYEELTSITHEDPEWIKLKDNTYNAPKMNLKEHTYEYKKRYKGLIEALNI